MTQRALWAGLLGCCGAVLAACGPTTLVVGVTPGTQRLQTTVVDSAGAWFADRVVIVDVAGLLYNFNSPGLLSEGENPVSVLAEKLEKARGDPDVKAVILRINSPGGTVNASDLMYREVLRFREKSHKPVVALITDVGASGGYYLACAADRILAAPTSITGSVGVIAQTVSLQAALNRIGVQTETIATGGHKAAGSLLADLKPEQRAVLQGLIDDFFQRFTAVVRRARPGISPEHWARITDGRVYSGEQALAAGLVDQLGDVRDAFALAKSLAHLASADLVVYHRPLQYVGSPYARAPDAGAAAGATQINIAQFNLGRLGAEWSPGFYYLWPGPGW